MARKGNPNGNPQNLIPFNQRTKEELQAMAHKANESKRKHKLFRDALIDVLDNMCEDGGDYRTEIMQALASKCKKGDTKAIELASKLCGEHIDRIEISGGDKPIEINLSGE